MRYTKISDIYTVTESIMKSQGALNCSKIRIIAFTEVAKHPEEAKKYLYIKLHGLLVTQDLQEARDSLTMH